MSKSTLYLKDIEIKNQTVGQFLDYLENKKNIFLSSHIASVRVWEISEQKESYSIIPLKSQLCEAIDVFDTKINEKQYTLFVGKKLTRKQELIKIFSKGLVLDHHTGLFKVCTSSPVIFDKTYQPVELPLPTSVAFEKRVIETVHTTDLKESNQNGFSAEISAFIISVETDYSKEKTKTSKSSNKTRNAVVSLLIKKILLSVDESRMDPDPLFIKELSSIVDNNNMPAFDRTKRVVELLNEYGWYVPNKFTLGGRLDVVKSLTEASSSSETNELDNLSIKLGAAYKVFSGSVGTSFKKASSANNGISGFSSNERVTSTVDGAIDIASFMENVKIEKNWRIIVLDKILPTCKFLLREHIHLFARLRRLIVENAHHELIRNLQPHLNMMKYMNDIWDEHVQPF